MVRTRPLAARLIAPAATVLLLLSGCAQEEPEPKFAEEPSATPTVEDEETAEEFIRRWNDEQRKMQRGDTAEYRRIAGECEPCMSAADRVEAIYRAGGYVKTQGRKILSIRPEEGRSPNTYIVDIDSSPTRLKETSDSAETTLKGGKNRFRVFLQRPDSEWVLAHFDLVPM